MPGKSETFFRNLRAAEKDFKSSDSGGLHMLVMNGKRRSRPIRKGLAWGLQSVDQRVCKSLAGGMEAATTENYEVRPNDQGRSSSIRDCG
ncbi:hypothetical protein ACVI1J_004861 [Bradyrhizobium diazoefficiens]